MVHARCLVVVILLVTAAYVAAPVTASSADDPALARLIDRALAVSTPTRSTVEYAQAAAAYRAIRGDLERFHPARVTLEDEVDADLLRSFLDVQIHEIETVRLHELAPASYFALRVTDSLFVRPCSRTDRTVRLAVQELRQLPAILASAKANLKVPARVWTENALAEADNAVVLLGDELPTACVDDPALKVELLSEGQRALQAVKMYRAWLKEVLLPRSTRSPAWAPELMDVYQREREQRDGYTLDKMLQVAEGEEVACREQMAALARRIHPSGDLRRVWETMKEAAPPWEEVLPQARDDVRRATEWLAKPGNAVVTIPGTLDWGVQVTSPLYRRSYSFGGSCQGHNMAGRRSGYYVLTPPEQGLTPEERTSMLKGYNPYWMHVISYHEWLGHVVHFAIDEDLVTRPMRQAGEANLTQAWAFYLEKLLEDKGYFETLPYAERLKTQMARLQMRMWRVQRILTKLRMARGEMTFEQAVDAYVNEIGMERRAAFIEVQRDSQGPQPPGAEIIGELQLISLRDEYQRRMGEHYSLQQFHDALLRYGQLPFKQIRRLMFGGDIGRNEGK